ncbi:MAG: MFS transporter [Flavobacteriales bacterium]|nr:MFS transporter [Flavobacteriales bacterium]
MPVSSYLGLASYLFWTIPLYAALGLLARNLQNQQIIDQEYQATEIYEGYEDSFKNADAVQILSVGGAGNFLQNGDEVRLYNGIELIHTFTKTEDLSLLNVDRSIFESASKAEIYKLNKFKLSIEGAGILSKYDELAVKKKLNKEEVQTIYFANGLEGFYEGGSVVRTFKNMFSVNIMYIIWGILGIMYLFKAYSILKFNLPRLKAGIPEEEKFHFGSVAALNTTYFANFGAELAVVSMLPMFFEGIFNFTPQMAGFVAMSFAFVNLFARPLGGYLSDKMGSRKKTMLMYMIGITAGFFLMGLISKYDGADANGNTILAPMFDGSWWIVVSVIITMFCSMFVQGAEGATFAMIPSIKKELTGRIAGMAGAYGNVGAVAYLFVLSMVDSKTFFFILAIGAGVSVLACLIMLKEPKNSFGEEEEEIDTKEMDKLEPVEAHA